MAELNPKQEAAQAFNDAIAAGHFTGKKGDNNWAGLYWYMGTDSIHGTRMFKHMDTRLYSNWQPEQSFLEQHGEEVPF